MNTHQDFENRLLSAKETREYLNVSENTLWKLYNNYKGRGQGFPKPIRIGHKVNFKKSDLDDWIQQQQDRPTA